VSGSTYTIAGASGSVDLDAHLAAQFFIST
jgi:hypothetical protein